MGKNKDWCSKKGCAARKKGMYEKEKRWKNQSGMPQKDVNIAALDQMRRTERIGIMPTWKP